MESSEIIYRISVASLAIIIALGAFNYLSCQVETFCDVQINGKVVGEINCNIVREQGAYTLQHISDYACSEPVLEKVRKYYDFGEVESCQYYCCVTDGTCYGFPPRGVNIQMLSITTEEARKG